MNLFRMVIILITIPAIVSSCSDVVSNTDSNKNGLCFSDFSFDESKDISLAEISLDMFADKHRNHECLDLINRFSNNTDRFQFILMKYDDDVLYGEALSCLPDSSFLKEDIENNINIYLPLVFSNCDWGRKIIDEAKITVNEPESTFFPSNYRYKDLSRELTATGYEPIITAGLSAGIIDGSRADYPVCLYNKKILNNKYGKKEELFDKAIKLCLYRYIFR